MNIPESFYTLDIESFTTDVNRPCVVQVGICLYYKGQYATHSVAVKPVMRNATLETLAWWAKQEGYGALIEDIKNTPYGHMQVNTALRETLNVVNHRIVQDNVFQGLVQEKRELLEYLKNNNWYAWPPGFDMVMVANQMLDCENIKIQPWEWWQVRCQSTIRDLYGDYREDVREEVNFTGGSHNAGYDAELQARSMVKALEVSKNG